MNPTNKRAFDPLWRAGTQTSDTLEIFIYSNIEADGYDWYTESVVESETSANHFKDLLTANADVKTIRLYINSRGGSVFEGTAIYNQLKRHTAQKIVRVDGFACSIASVIAMAGDTVIMAPNTLMMVHDMSMCACGNARDLRKAADDLEVMNAAGRSAYLVKAGTKLAEEQLIAMMTAETWLTASQCFDYGLCDEIADYAVTVPVVQLAQSTAAMQQLLAERQAMARQMQALDIRQQTPVAPQQNFRNNAASNFAAFFTTQK